MTFQTKTIGVGQLLLDVENPRHGEVSSQREAIEALIAEERQKLVVLGADILKYGLSPIDRLLVVKSKRTYVVVEGNRRLAVVKILANPSLAQGSPIEGQMKLLSAAGPIPGDVDCAIAPSRDDAKHWMELRHGGEAEGAGVVPWNTFAAARFAKKPNSEAGAAIRFLEELEKSYPKNGVVQSLIREVANRKLTTLGRLVLDSSFQQRAGMAETEEGLVFHYPAAELEGFFEHVLGDLASTVGVSDLRKKPDRAKYLKSTPKPDAEKRKTEPSALTKSSSSKPKSKPARRKRPSKPAKPFHELDLSKLGERTENILREFQGIDVDLRPNATALLTRAILELSVDQYIAEKKLPTDGKLKKRVQRALYAVDSTQKDRKFQGVRQGLGDSNNMFSVSTLHGYVHNPHFHPDGSTIRSIAANLTPFLQALNNDL